MSQMTAILCTDYGTVDVLKLRQVTKPSPKADQILVQLVATSVTSGDCEMRSCKMHPSMYPLFRLMLGLRRPRNPILGMYFSGVVVELGSAVTHFKLGDEIFGTTSFKMGTNAEYVVIPETAAVITKPKNLDHVSAAAAPLGAWNAQHFLKEAKIKSGESILIVGACGAIGTCAIQLAKRAGLKITAIDASHKLQVLKDLGAERVIDYAKTDFTKEDIQYDIIFDVVGKSPFKKSLDCLTPNGRYLLANVGFTPMLRGAWVTRTTDKTVISAMARETKAELLQYRKIVEVEGMLPVVDRVFSLSEIPKAHEYIENEQRKGNVVVDMAL